MTTEAMKGSELIKKARKSPFQKSVLETAPQHLLDDKTTMLKMTQFMYSIAEYVSDRLKADRDFMLKLVKQDGSALKYASAELKNDDEVVLTAIEQNGRNIIYANSRFQEDRELVLKVVKKQGYSLEVLSDKFKDDKEIVLQAVRHAGGGVLRAASLRLQNDEDIAKELIAKDFQNFAYLGEEIRAHRELAMQVAKIHHMGGGYIAKSLRADKAFMLEVLEVHPTSITYASDELKVDKDMLRKGYIDYDLLDYAIDLRDDREFLLEIYKNHRFLHLNHLSERLKDDKDFFNQLMEINPRSIAQASERLQNDVDLVSKIKFHKSCYSQLEDIGETLRNTYEIAMKGVSTDGKGLRFLNEKLRKNKEIVLAAVRENGKALKFADQSLQKDKEIVLAAINEDGEALEFVDKTLQKNKEIVMVAVANSPTSLRFASKDFRNDKALVLSLLKSVKDYERSYLLQCVGKELRKEIGKNAPIKYLTEVLKTEGESLPNIIDSNSVNTLTKKKIKP